MLLTKIRRLFSRWVRSVLTCGDRYYCVILYALFLACHLVGTPFPVAAVAVPVVIIVVIIIMIVIIIISIALWPKRELYWVP